MRSSSISKCRLLSTLALLGLVAVIGVAAADKAKPADQDKKYVRPTDPSLYVGAETCKTCHEDMPSKGFFKSYEDSPHYVTMLDTKRGPEWHGCEACHGPGKAHVEGGGDKTKIFIFKNASTREINSRCLDCHAGGPQHMNALNSEHTRNDVSCISCHSPHHAKESEFLLVKSQPELVTDAICSKKRSLICLSITG